MSLPRIPVEFPRQKWIDHLDKIFNTIHKLRSPFLNPSDYSKYAIKQRLLTIADDGSYSESQPPQPCFFAPLSQEKIDSHPVNLDYREDELSDDLHLESRINAEILTELAEPRIPLEARLFFAIIFSGCSMTLRE